MKKIKGKQEQTPEKGNRLGNVYIALRFSFVHAVFFIVPKTGKECNGLKMFIIVFTFVRSIFSAVNI